MKQPPVGKVCAWNERGVDDEPGRASPRFSGHLRASACICGHLPASGRCLLARPQVLRASILFYFVSSAGSLLMQRMMSEARDFSTIIYRPSSDVSGGRLA